MHIPLKLIWKLVLINSTSLIVMLMFIAVAIHWLAAAYFMKLMQEYSIDPSDVQAMFLSAVDRFLIIASLSGFVVGSLLSMWLSYRLLKPVSQIMLAAAQISKGDFKNRVTVKGCGEIDQLSAIFNDMADNLQRVEKLRKDFVIDVAHELRTPLTNIRGYMEGLRDNVITADPAVFESLHEETLRLVKLVEELLQLARADLAKSNLHIERFDLSELVMQCLRAFEPRFAASNLQVQCSRPSVFICGDRERLTQVLTNLCENALRYTPEGGRIAVKIAADSERVRLAMINDTEEPPPSSAQPLFERFQRGDQSRSREFGGAGLGLAIVKELITAHRGSVGYSFENEQAEFWFEIPVSYSR